MPATFTCDYCGKDLGAEYADYEGWEPYDGITYRYRQKPRHYTAVVCNTADENNGCWLLFRRRENIELYIPEKGDAYYRKMF